jgi:two-component system C4-dicarboxylate transport sensor histidine kinase DctB
MAWRRIRPGGQARGATAGADRLLPRLPWMVRILIVLGIVVAGVAVWIANALLTERLVEDTRNRAELRQALYAGAILSELQRNSVVPLLLARDPTLIAGLNAEDFTASSQRLISFVEEIGAASIRLLDMDGRTVAATAREELGTRHREAPFFAEAQDTTDTVFTLVPNAETGAYEASFSRIVQDGPRQLGVLQVQVDLAQFESRWRGTTAAVAVTDSAGTVILSTEPTWRGRLLEEALKRTSVPSALERALGAHSPFRPDLEETFATSSALLQLEARVPFRGWRLVSFTSYESVRERVNGVLALIIMGFAL